MQDDLLDLYARLVLIAEFLQAPFHLRGDFRPANRQNLIDAPVSDDGPHYRLVHVVKRIGAGYRLRVEEISDLEQILVGIADPELRRP